jgi:hypothetical protein
VCEAVAHGSFFSVTLLKSGLARTTGCQLKPISTVAAIIFLLVAVAHIIRVALGWAVTVNGVSIPIWVSVIAAVIATALAFLLWRDPRS